MLRSLLFLTIFAGVGSSVFAQDHAMDQVPVADVHVHILDFLQNGSYLKDGKEQLPRAGDTLPAGSRHFRLLLLLQRMNECNVSHAMVSGMPFVKKWSEDDAFRSPYYLSSSSRVTRARDTDYVIALAFEDFKQREPERFEKEFPRLFPFICGFNGTDLGAVGMIVKRIKEFPGLWKGVGEVMSRHDDLTNLSLGERPRADHPSLLRIYDFAGEFGLPVSIHHNIAPVSHNGQDLKTRYLDEISARSKHSQRRSSSGVIPVSVVVSWLTISSSYSINRFWRNISRTCVSIFPGWSLKII